MGPCPVGRSLSHMQHRFCAMWFWLQTSIWDSWTYVGGNSLFRPYGPLLFHPGITRVGAIGEIHSYHGAAMAIATSFATYPHFGRGDCYSWRHRGFPDMGLPDDGFAHDAIWRAAPSSIWRIALRSVETSLRFLYSRRSGPVDFTDRISQQWGARDSSGASGNLGIT